jgi:hypothetical protein
VPLPVSELNASFVTISEDRGAIPLTRSNTSCGMAIRSSAVFALSGSVIGSTSRRRHRIDQPWARGLRPGSSAAVSLREYLEGSDA